MAKSMNTQNQNLKGSSVGQNRRNFLKTMAAVSGTLAFSPLKVMAGPFSEDELLKFVPVDKKLHPDWVKSLYERGKPTIYKGEELRYIGMPVGGIFTGQLYLGGDGRLWRWDIFNHSRGTGAAHYTTPPEPEYLVEQGFELLVGDKSYSLDKEGFKDVSFMGQYPVAEVTYKDNTTPLEIVMEAYSPFIPLDSEDSGIPATVMQFKISNTSDIEQDGALLGKLENAVCLHHRQMQGKRVNKHIKGNNYNFLSYSAKNEEVVEEPRPELLYEDWNKTDYVGWTVEGQAFGSGPIKKSDIPAYQGDVGGDTERVVNSHATAPGNEIGEKDAATGRLISSKFNITRKFINIWIGGGAHKTQTCVNLWVEGELVHSITGKNNNRMEQRAFHVGSLEGKEAHLEIVDNYQGGWGNIGVGKISFSDVSSEYTSFESLGDYGSMGLALLNEKADILENEDAESYLSEKLVGKIGKNFTLKPGESKQIVFVITWNFPNISNGAIGNGRYYANKFSSAEAVAIYVADNFSSLSSTTKLWRDTWYDSSLPYWLLDRTFLNISTAATNTCYRYKNGRMWAWEGVGCCAGTCTHVWHYAQALARIFPDIERDTRERVDMGVALNMDNGVSGFRAENHQAFAVDGQSGTILRIYREHQMTPNNEFLSKNWSKIKLMFEPLFNLDPEGDGLLEGAQMNTLDRPWYGKISWLSSIYLAALRAGEAMANEMGETEFATRCKRIIENGKKNIDQQLFNGEYYYQIGEQGNTNQVGSYDGCEIDQMLGQSWVLQLGLDRVLSKENSKTALKSLWKYNFAIDAGGYRNFLNAGRIYAMEGEAGLLMCSWPKGDSKRVKIGHDYYFNECMTGFEYQVAWQMIWDGLLEEGLAITKAIHDRYHAIKRNPWNEVECGDHYARAMASYGVYTAISGFSYHGPKGKIGFAPKLNPENFKAAFTAAEGWGTFTQKNDGQGKIVSDIEIKYGSMQVKILELGIPENINTDSIQLNMTYGGNNVQHTQSSQDGKLNITYSGAGIILKENKMLKATITYDLATSFEDIQEGKNDFSTYPVPSEGMVNFSFLSVPDKLIISDLKGKVLFQEQISGNQYKFDGSILKKGVYIAIADFSGEKVSKKIILS